MEENEKKVSNTKRNIIISVICSLIVLIILGATVYYINIVIPSQKMEQLNEWYNNKKYEDVISTEKDLDVFRKYLNNDEAYDEIVEKINISKLMICYNNKEYTKALDIIKIIKTPNSEVLAIENECKYNVAIEKIDNKEYTQALTFLNYVTGKDDVERLKDQIHLSLAVENINNEKYYDAIEELELIKDKELESYTETKNKAHYEYGKNLFAKKDYDNAIGNFDLCVGYEDSDIYRLKCSMGIAENLIKKEQYDDAKLIYDTIPNEIEYNGINSTSRKSQLEFYKKNINSFGEWKSTKEYIESRNIWRYNGSWDNWYIDEISDSTKLTIKFVLNTDGTMSMKINANFYSFSNFSTLQSLCNAHMTYKSTEIKDLTVIPSTIKLDEYTTLTYSNGKYTLKYSKRDDYSTSFYNMYNSTVTFGEKVS